MITEDHQFELVEGARGRRGFDRIAEIRPLTSRRLGVG
jgi:hypothetical protein